MNEKLLNLLDDVFSSTKEIDNISDWRIIPDRNSRALCWTTAVRLRDFLGKGVSIRIRTPIDVWESDVYGHIEVRTDVTHDKAARILPIEWRPRNPHRNPKCNSKYSLQQLNDRWHPYPINRSLNNPDVFFQKIPGIAEPLPTKVNSFKEYLNFCSVEWNCVSIREVPTPPWQPTLL